MLCTTVHSRQDVRATVEPRHVVRAAIIHSRQVVQTAVQQRYVVQARYKAHCRD